MNPIARTRISMLRLEQVMGMSIKAGTHESLEDGAWALTKGSQDFPNFWVIRGFRTSLAQITSGARQYHIGDGWFPTLRSWDYVIQMKYAAAFIKKLQDPAPRYFGLRGALPAVTTDTLIPLTHKIANMRRYVARIRHAVSFATWDALRIARVEWLQTSACELVDRMIAVEPPAEELAA